MRPLNMALSMVSGAGLVPAQCAVQEPPTLSWTYLLPGVSLEAAELGLGPEAGHRQASPTSPGPEVDHHTAGSWLEGSSWWKGHGVSTVEARASYSARPGAGHGEKTGVSGESPQAEGTEDKH